MNPWSEVSTQIPGARPLLEDAVVLIFLQLRDSGVLPGTVRPLTRAVVQSHLKHSKFSIISIADVLPGVSEEYTQACV